MRKYLSYVLPLGALLILAFLAYRWISNRPATDLGEISPSGEGIEIEDVTGDERLPNGVADLSTAPLESATTSATPISGQIRYGMQTEEGRTVYTITTTLPEPEEGSFYQLWFEGETGRKKAQRLQPGKGGYFAEGVLSSEFSSLNVLVSQETEDDEELEKLLLRGSAQLEETEQE